VVRNFDKAGIPRRGPGPPLRDVPAAEIQRLRDEGLTMPEVATTVGTTINIARKRYRRTHHTGDSRAAIPSRREASKFGRWQAVFIDALTTSVITRSSNRCIPACSPHSAAIPDVSVAA
jgi:hypothetical protein